MATVKDVNVKYFWTDEMSTDAMNDFIKVHNQVFNSSFNEHKFGRKYKKNIYGSSIIVLAYLGNKCVGARAFWRNDLDGLKAYQPGDTAVLKEYRGFGIFTKMTYKALEVAGDDALIYNFPNDNSLPGYLKMGWDLHSRKRYKIYNPLIDYKDVDKIESDYMDWLLIDKDLDFNNSLFYSNIKGKYYLLKKRKFNLYVVIAEIDKEYAYFFRKAIFPICLHHSLKGYFGRGLVTVTRNFKEEIDIPLYKMDTIF